MDLVRRPSHGRTASVPACSFPPGSRNGKRPAGVAGHPIVPSKGAFNQEDSGAEGTGSRKAMALCRPRHGPSPSRSWSPSHWGPQPCAGRPRFTEPRSPPGIDKNASNHVTTAPKTSNGQSFDISYMPSKASGVRGDQAGGHLSASGVQASARLAQRVDRQAASFWHPEDRRTSSRPPLRLASVRGTGQRTNQGGS